MSHDLAQTASAPRRFDVSLDDFRKQAGASGFWRGLAVGFVSAFFLFDYALAQGAAVRASVAFAARNGIALLVCLGAVIASVALGHTAVRAVRAGRERRGHLKQVRERLGL
jgi:F0F1-type ATP synthase membrane subunit c/vacuolar-type H+-ATPase subunit K